jgi:protein transport protein SEC61 subunit gamma-like protein|tara:strand:+ start:188 stop:391 length:204 start_codon:yes stop_codon:yes gene_type:complete
MEEEINYNSFWFKTKRFLMESRRVLKVTKKPDQFEFKTIVKASGLGILIIGLVGFLLHAIVQVFKGI